MNFWILWIWSIGGIESFAFRLCKKKTKFFANFNFEIWKTFGSISKFIDFKVEEIHRILEKCKAFENLRFSMCKNWKFWQCSVHVKIKDFLHAPKSLIFEGFTGLKNCVFWIPKTKKVFGKLWNYKELQSLCQALF